MNSLQKLLLTNAIFSTLNGILLLLFPHKIAQLFNLESSVFFLFLGGALLFFAFSLIIEIKKQRALPILWIIVQDMLWVIGSLVLLIWNPFHISTEGNLVIAGVGVVVLLLGIGQARALARIDEGKTKGQKLFRFSRIVKGDKSKVWSVISDVANYHEVAPNIDSSKVISGTKEGMIRSCAHGKDSWTETCSLWEEEKQYSFIVDTSPTDYPYPLALLKGTWQINELEKEKTEIVMLFEFEYKKYIQNILVHPFMKYQFTKVCKELLDNWQAKIE